MISNYNSVVPAHATPQDLLNSTPIHDLNEQFGTRATTRASFQPIDMFLDHHIDPNNVSSTIDAMLGDISLLMTQIDQSQRIGMTPSETNGCEIIDLDDIESVFAGDKESTVIEILSDTTCGNSFHEGTSTQYQTTSNGQKNKSKKQKAARMGLTCKDNDTSSEGTSIEQNAVKQEPNQRRKRKSTNVRSAQKDNPELVSGEMIA